MTEEQALKQAQPLGTPHLKEKTNKHINKGHEAGREGTLAGAGVISGGRL